MGIDIRNAESIVVPRGERFGLYAEAVSEEYDVDFPQFGEYEDKVMYAGREYIRVDECDIPRVVRSGLVDVGVAGLDTCVESAEYVSFRSFGQAYGYFELMADAPEVAAVRTWATEGRRLQVATPYPRLLGSCALRAGMNGIVPLRSAMRLGDQYQTPRSAVADIVPVAQRVEDLGLQSVLRLRTLRPAVVSRKEEINR